MRTWLVLAILALALVLAWSRLARREAPEPPARELEHPPAGMLAPLEPSPARSEAMPQAGQADPMAALLALSRSSPERLDLARGVVDWEFMAELRDLVLQSRLDASEFIRRCSGMELEDGARPALVLALAWCPDPEGVAGQNLLQWIGLPGRRTNIEEQCALAAVRALGFSGRGAALENWLNERLQPGAGLEEGLQSVRAWIALQELESAPVAAASLLLGDEAPTHLPERVQEELWASAVRSGDPAWNEEVLKQAIDGSPAALGGLAFLRDPAQQGALLALHSDSNGWVRIAAQKALLSMAGGECIQAWLGDLGNLTTRDGALEALRAWCSDRCADPGAVASLRSALRTDEEALSVLESVLRRDALRARVRAARR